MNKLFALIILAIVGFSGPTLALTYKVVDKSIAKNAEAELYYASTRMIFSDGFKKKKCTINGRQFFKLKSRIDRIRKNAGVTDYAQRYGDVMSPNALKQAFHYIYGVPKNRLDEFEAFFFKIASGKKSKVSIPEFCSDV